MMDRLQKTSTLQTNLYSARRGHVEDVLSLQDVKGEKKGSGLKS